MKVLVVDDQELNRNLLNHMLKHEGFDVVLAENGRQAIEVCKQEDPDLVLLDVVMPELDGYETAPLLKELSTEVYLPIIFITALGDQDSLKRCLEVGGDDFLNKPFDRVILQAKIKAHSRIRDLSIKTYKQKKQLDFYKLKTEREHQIVEHIFHRALTGNYQVPHLLNFHLSPASLFNGDIMLVALGPTGSLYVMMGDFTGHGLAAAVGTLPVSSTFYSSAQKGLPVGEIAYNINEALLTLLPDDMFCAACIVELSSQGKSLSIWAGGTPDVYILNDSDGVTHTINSQHMALGILDSHEFELTSENYNVGPEDRLMLATDGVTESFNQQGEMFGEERLLSLLNHPEKNQLADVLVSLTDFRGSAEQDDDISILFLRCDAVNSEMDSGQSNFSKLSHEYRLTLDKEAIQNTDPVIEVVDILSVLKGADLHRSTLFLLISEAYNNALDHGILGLDSKMKETEDGFLEFYMQRAERLEQLDDGRIEIDVRYHANSTCIEIVIKDSGQGFDTSRKVVPENSDQEHGRGTMLLQQLASEVNYNEKGNQITIIYKLDDLI